MSGHTPGPWFLDDDETGMIVYPATWKGCDNRTRRMALIAAVSPWDGRAQENREAVMAEAHANAALIASAPTLSAQVATLTAERDAYKAALSDTYNELAHWAQSEDCDHSVGICMCSTKRALEAARAALEGGRP